MKELSSSTKDISVQLERVKEDNEDLRFLVNILKQLVYLDKTKESQNKRSTK